MFYQPLQQDSVLEAQQWQQVFQAMREAGGTELVLQWGRYGHFEVEQALPELLKVVRQQQLPVWQGLYADPDYFHRPAVDTADQLRYWRDQLELSYQQLVTWQTLWPDAQLLGWYLPIELHDEDLADPERLRFWQQQLSLFSAASRKPVAVSLFFNGKLTAQQWQAGAAKLRQTGVQLWLQDGAGAALVSEAKRRTWLQTMGCQNRWISEVFRRSSSEGETFAARPANEVEWQQQQACANSLWFELRYLPQTAAFFSQRTKLEQ